MFCYNLYMMQMKNVVKLLQAFFLRPLGPRARIGFSAEIEENYKLLLGTSI